MSKYLLALVLATVPAFTVPAGAQTYEEQRRWDAAQSRYQHETDVYQQERDAYYAARDRGRGGYRGYDGAPPPPPQSGGYGQDPYATNYDAARYYREDPRYQERPLNSSDMVYRGSDGRYYCKRNDGTVGLIVGGVGGALIGNVIDGGRHRTGGTLIGGALGALAGTAIAQNQSNDVRCR